MKVAIFGNGLLGLELHKQTGWDIYSRSENGLELNNPDSYINFLIDWIDDSYNGRLGYCLNYNVVVNCIANTNSYSIDAQSHIDTNYVGVGKLVDLCNKYEIKLVHISSEFVYANNPVPAKETDLPIPVINWYGVSKLLGDFIVEKNCNNFLLCRLLHKQKNLSYKDVWRVKTSGDTVDKIASIVVKLINRDIQGVINVGTQDKFLREIINAENEIDPPTYVPKDTTMNLDKLKNILKNEI